MMALIMTRSMRLNVENVEPGMAGRKAAVSKPVLRPRNALGDIGNQISKAKVPLKRATKALRKPPVEKSEKLIVPEDYVPKEAETPVPDSPNPMETSVCVIEEIPPAFSSALIPIKDVDAEDSDNPMLCSDYVKDIYCYLRNMEMQILRVLKFDIGRPLPLHFLRRASKIGEVDSVHHTLAKYLIELVMTDYDMVHVPPSQLAAAAFCLAMKILNSGEWTPVLEHYMAYKESSLMPVMQHIAKNIVKVNGGHTKFLSVKSKYSSSRQMKVSCLPHLKSELVESLAKAAS
ncbi:hypothetical protein XENTR_v10002868 [Xenopus tropicalis]|nr:hypothetical protein XENTR_v10002868 [Xenopus tropicalis]